MSVLGYGIWGEGVEAGILGIIILSSRYRRGFFF